MLHKAKRIERIDRESLITAVESSHMWPGIKRKLLKLINAIPEDKAAWYKKNAGDICYTCDHCLTTDPSGTAHYYCPNCGRYMGVWEVD